jgi:hypothetical protein
MLMWWLILVAFGVVYVLLARSIRDERLRVLWVAAGALVLGFATGFCVCALLIGFLWGPPTDTPGIVGRILTSAIVGVGGALLAIVAALVVWARFRSRLNGFCTALSIVAALACAVLFLFQ